MEAKNVYVVENSPDDVVDALKITGVNFFLNVKKLPLIQVGSLINSLEVEKTRCRRLKNSFICNMKNEWESDLNLTRMHITN